MSPRDQLCQAFTDRTARVAVVGATREAHSFIQALAAAGFSTVAPDDLSKAETLVLSIPMVFTSAATPDTTCLDQWMRDLACRRRPGQLIVLIGPTPPGTTRTVVLPALTDGGYVPGQDFFLAHGSKGEGDGNRPTSWIVGGSDLDSLDVAMALFEQISPNSIRVSSLETAELAGLIGLTVQAIHTAAANDLKRICDRMAVDHRELLDAIQPAGFPVLTPGPGGYDWIPSLLAWGVRRYGASTRLVELASEVNAAMPEFVVSKLADALNAIGKPLKGSRVTVLGLSENGDRVHLMTSPGFEIADLLVRKGALVTVNDPHMATHAQTFPRPKVPMIENAPLTAEHLASQDAALIAVNHLAYDYDFIVAHSQLVIDTRNATKAVTIGRAKIVHA